MNERVVLMTLDERRLKLNIAAIQDRVAAACARVGRDPDAVRLVAVTKYAELEWVRGLLQFGMTRLGESRPQQLVERTGLLQDEIVHVVHLLQVILRQGS